MSPGRDDEFAALDLSRRFETSRSPVREALLALERKILIDIKPAVGRAWPRPNVVQIVEIYQLRGHLHGIVARNVVEKATDSDVLDLESALDQMNNAFVQWNVDNYLR